MTKDELQRAARAWDVGTYGRDDVTTLLTDLDSGKFRNVDDVELPPIAPAPAPFSEARLERSFGSYRDIYYVTAKGDPFTPALSGLQLYGPEGSTNLEAVNAWNAMVEALGPLIPTPQAIATLRAAQTELASVVAGGVRSVALPMVEDLLMILVPRA